VQDSRNRSGNDLEMRLKSNLPKSRSEKNVKNAEQGMEDKITIMTQMFWIAVSLLESDYEYEFLLATQLLDKVVAGSRGSLLIGNSDLQALVMECACEFVLLFSLKFKIKSKIKPLSI